MKYLLAILTHINTHTIGFDINLGAIINQILCNGKKTSTANMVKSTPSILIRRIIMRSAKRQYRTGGYNT